MVLQLLSNIDPLDFWLPRPDKDHPYPPAVGRGRCHIGKKLSLLDSVECREERLTCRLPENKSAPPLCHQKAWTRPGGPSSLLITYAEYSRLCKAEQQGVPWKSITFLSNSPEIKGLTSLEGMSHSPHPFHRGPNTWHNHLGDHRSVQIIARRRRGSSTPLGKCSNYFPSRSLCCQEAK